MLTRPRGDHQLQDADRAEADRDHDAERQVEAHQRVAAEAVFGQREGGHGAEQQHEEQRGDGDDQAVLEVADEVALAEHGRVADQVEGRRRRQRQRRAEDRRARLERVHHDEEDREQRDQRVDDQDGVRGQTSRKRAAGLRHRSRVSPLPDRLGAGRLRASMHSGAGLAQAGRLTASILAAPARVEGSARPAGGIERPHPRGRDGRSRAGARAKQGCTRYPAAAWRSPAREACRRASTGRRPATPRSGACAQPPWSTTSRSTDPVLAL